jgi:hypothetical protein
MIGSACWQVGWQEDSLMEGARGAGGGGLLGVEESIAGKYSTIIACILAACPLVNCHRHCISTGCARFGGVEGQHGKCHGHTHVTAGSRSIGTS